MDRRIKEATDEERERFGRVLKVEYMSEDEDAENGGWCHLKLNWRSETVSKFFCLLDSRAKAKKKPHMSQTTKRTKIGLSYKRAPNNAPEWALKPAQPKPTESRSAKNNMSGKNLVLTTREERISSQTPVSTGQRPGARRAINYSAQDVVDSILD